MHTIAKIAAALALGLVLSDSRAEPLGAVRNDIGGVIMFLSEQPAPCAGAFRVESRGPDGGLLHTGCYAVHNRVSVVVLWDKGPARVIPASAVEWVQQDAAPKAIGKPDLTL